MNIVMTDKGDYIQFRISDDLKADAKIAARLRGLSISALITSYLVRVVREEKDRSPHEFPRRIKGVRSLKKPIVVGEITSPKAERARIQRELDAVELKEPKKRKTG